MRSAYVARVAVATHHDLLILPTTDAAAYRAGRPPDNLGVVADVLYPPCIAVGRENSPNEIGFLGDPEIDHFLGRISTRCAAPDIFAF